MQQAFKLASQHVMTRAVHNKQIYDCGLYESHLAVGDRVLVCNLQEHGAPGCIGRCKCMK